MRTAIAGRYVGSSVTRVEDHRLLTGAGFENVRMRMLPVEPDAKGPALFAAMAVKQ